MTEEIPAPSRRRAAARLGVVVLFLAVLFYLVAVRQVIDIDAVRDLIRASGPVAPLVFVPVSALLAAIFVPGTLLAATSGLLFGPLVGTFVTLFSAVGTAMITSLLGRRAGRASARGLIGAERSDRIDAQIARGGLWAVVGQRFVPGISDAMASYVFGAFGVPLWQMVAGSFIGSAPRAFVYTALGASIGEFSAPLAYTAIGVWCVTAVLGVFAAHRGYRMWRHRPRQEPAAEPPVPS
ncbi:TVP38/TMEM64 family protein [Nocardia sp. NPDC057227]|uniref:TVP38/TMEM64 family protein n=1 Tax=Nocardia sp. NPDC057227 TaxID=3346056 RepID=UPI00362B3493